MLLFIINEFISNKEKLEYLYDNYKKLLLYKAYGVCKNYSTSEDIVSETFIKIQRNLDKIEDVKSPQSISYISVILKNTAINYVKKEKHHSDIGDYSYELNSGDNTENLIVNKMMTDNILIILDTLKEDLRIPFLLKYAHGYTHSEIANELNISESNVGVRVHRSKSKLIKIMKERGDFDE